MLVVKVLAAVCAADNTDEKNPVEGVVTSTPFSGVGVRGGRLMLDSLLGPALPERSLRCPGTAAPEGGVPFDAVVLAESAVPGLPGVDVAEPFKKKGFVGVGGVLTMTGAGLSADGGVRGGACGSICGRDLDRDRLSVEDLCVESESLEVESSFGRGGTGGISWDEIGRSRSVSLAPDFSGLELLFRLELLFFDRKIPLILPAGDGDRFAVFCGGWRLVLLRLNRDSESPELDDWLGNVDARSASDCDSGWWTAWMSGEDVVR